MHAPSEAHMGVMRILSYLKGAQGRGFTFRKYRHMEVKAYIDENWIRNMTDQR